jgi:exopolyphosphatase/guanosine-5'-triphosphate,3'-diphosphate pyrophosphatase
VDRSGGGADAVTVAVIDIGTNTVLLLVVRATEGAAMVPLLYEQRIPRLGRGVDAGKNLLPDAMERAIGVLQEYRELMATVRPDVTVVCGTSVVRDAGNREKFRGMVRDRTGLELEVLSGEDEASWTYRGALSGMQGVTKATVVDIGGGSTEIAVGDSMSVAQRISLDIGSVRISERFFRHDPPTHPELESAIELIENEIARARGFLFEGSTLVGVAGTATSLAALAQGLVRFDVNAVSNYRLSRDVVENLFRTLRAMSSGRIHELSDMMAGRSDIITAGALILREIMAHYGFSEMIVSERGVRYGLALRELDKAGHSF